MKTKEEIIEKFLSEKDVQKLLHKKKRFEAEKETNLTLLVLAWVLDIPIKFKVVKK